MFSHPELASRRELRHSELQDVLLLSETYIAERERMAGEGSLNVEDLKVAAMAQREGFFHPVPGHCKPYLCHGAAQAEHYRRDVTLYAPATCQGALPNRDGIDRHPDAAS
jgi:hypothetical protein